MKVSIGVHGRYHAFDLARELYIRGHDVNLLTTYPQFVVRKFISHNIKLQTVPSLEILRRVSQKIGFNFDSVLAQKFGKFFARNIYDSEIIFGWSSVSLEAIDVAHQHGMKFVLERGSAHILTQNDILHNEYNKWGIKWNGIDQKIISRELEEYSKADIITVGSEYSASTFLAHGVHKDKIYVNQYGVDLANFRVARNQQNNKLPRILFIGTVGIRKGVPILLEAFNMIGPKAELHIIGNLESSISNIIKKYKNDNIIIRGPIPSILIAEELSRADILCLPSVEEGFGMVILQAMAAGVPVIASNVTGGIEVIDNYQDGILVPVADKDKLAEALDFLLTYPAIRQKMGEAARQKTLGGWSWSNYGQRANRLIDMIANTK